MIDTQSAPPFPDLPRGRKPADVPSPAWRWELAMGLNREARRPPAQPRTWHRGRQVRFVQLPGYYQTHPIWTDPVLRCFVFPAIRMGLVEPQSTLAYEYRDTLVFDDGVRPDYFYADMDAYYRLLAAYHMWASRKNDCRHRAYRLMASILSGRRPEEGVPGVADDLDINTLFEALFFNVRPRLAEREWIADQVFRDLLTDSYGNGWGLQACMISYTFGFANYLTWDGGEVPRNVGRLLGLLDRTVGKSTDVGGYRLGPGLNLCGFDAPSKRAGASMVASWLLRQCNRIKEGRDLAVFPDDEMAANPHWKENQTVWEYNFPKLREGAMDVSDAYTERSLNRS